MAIHTLEDILPFVEKPSRYLGSEVNVIKKDPAKVKLRFALAFPDLYEIGTSHFGMQILYQILNAEPEIAAERVFAPGADMETLLRRAGLPLFSLESRAPLKTFDIIGFSLLYELNYTNVLTILDLAQIPFLAAERDRSHPLIVGGGPCTCNPEPIADFFDAIVVGDGEKVVMEMARCWLRWKTEPRRDKGLLLQKWSRIEGVYIPSFFKTCIDDNGFQTVAPLFPNHHVVKRAVVGDLDQVPFPDKPVIPFGKPVHDRLRLEVSRGCTRGCRFCQAGMIYRPVRERSPEHLLSLAADSLAATGYEDLSLLSLSSGDYGCIVPVMQRLMARYAEENVAISLPSLRAETLTPELMTLIKKVRKTGFTIAPEAGSQRLRDVINKNISDRDIIDTVKDAFSLGWQVIKLYFMIGLPTETDDDLRALTDLVKTLHKIKIPGGRRGKINVSIATFIPKPHTPFQWASQDSLEESKQKINRLHDRLKLPGIQFKWQNPEVSRLEGLWARGDRRLSRLLVRAYHKGCRFDGWSDHFNYRLWEEAFAETGVDPDFFTARIRDVREPLPWDHIDIRVSKSFLIKEREKAFEGEITDDCRRDACQQCGVCDFEVIKVKTFEGLQAEPADFDDAGADKSAGFKKLQIHYSKQDQAKYFGHLELVNIFLRALNRAKIPVKFSEGFHPKPKISFDDPLPVGIESQEEHFVLTVPDTVQAETVIHRLNAQLPDGICVHDCRPAQAVPQENGLAANTYLVILKETFLSQAKLDAFLSSSDFLISQINRKGKLKKIDLRDMVIHIETLDSASVKISLKSEPGKTARPADVLRYVFNVPEDEIKRARIVKLKDEGNAKRA